MVELFQSSLFDLLIHMSTLKNEIKQIWHENKQLPMHMLRESTLSECELVTFIANDLWLADGPIAVMQLCDSHASNIGHYPALKDWLAFTSSRLLSPRTKLLTPYSRQTGFCDVTEDVNKMIQSWLQQSQQQIHDQDMPPWICQETVCNTFENLPVSSGGHSSQEEALMAWMTRLQAWRSVFEYIQTQRIISHQTRVCSFRRTTHNECLLPVTCCCATKQPIMGIPRKCNVKVCRCKCCQWLSEEWLNSPSYMACVHDTWKEIFTHASSVWVSLSRNESQLQTQDTWMDVLLSSIHAHVDSQENNTSQSNQSMMKVRPWLPETDLTTLGFLNHLLSRFMTTVPRMASLLDLCAERSTLSLACLQTPLHYVGMTSFDMNGLLPEPLCAWSNAAWQMSIGSCVKMRWEHELTTNHSFNHCDLYEILSRAEWNRKHSIDYPPTSHWFVNDRRAATFFFVPIAGHMRSMSVRLSLDYVHANTVHGGDYPVLLWCCPPKHFPFQTHQPHAWLAQISHAFKHVLREGGLMLIQFSSNSDHVKIWNKFLTCLMENGHRVLGKWENPLRYLVLKRESSSDLLLSVPYARKSPLVMREEEYVPRLPCEAPPAPTGVREDSVLFPRHSSKVDIRGRANQSPRQEPTASPDHKRVRHSSPDQKRNRVSPPRRREYHNRHKHSY